MCDRYGLDDQVQSLTDDVHLVYRLCVFALSSISHEPLTRSIMGLYVRIGQINAFCVPRALRDPIHASSLLIKPALSCAKNITTNLAEHLQRLIQASRDTDIGRDVELLADSRVTAEHHVQPVLERAELRRD